MNRTLLFFLLTFFSQSLLGQQNEASSFVFVYSEDVTTSPGAQVCIDIKVDGFQEIDDARFILVWEEDILHNISIKTTNELGQPYLPGLDLASDVEIEGRAAIIQWRKEGGWSLADGSTFFQFCFEVKSTITTETKVFFNNLPSESFYGTDSRKIRYVHRDISVNIVGQATEGVLSVGNTTAEIGEQVCLPVTAKNIGELSGLQFALDWDDTSLTLEDVDFGDDPLDLANFPSAYVLEEDEFRMIWLDYNGQSVDLGDSIVLFNLCFEVTDDEVFQIPISFASVIPLEVTGSDNSVIPTRPEDGSIKFSENEFSTTDVALSIGNSQAAVGDQVCLPVTARNFSALAATKFGIEWETDDLTLKSIDFGDDPLQLEDHPALYILREGEVYVEWVPYITGLPADIGTLDLGDSTVLFSLCFEVLQLDGTTGIDFLPTTDRFIDDVDGTRGLFDVRLIDGFIETPREEESTSFPQLIIGNTEANSGEHVCLPVTAKDLGEVASLQFSIGWDSTYLSFDSLKLGNDIFDLTNNPRSYFVTETDFRLAWLDLSGNQTVELSDSTVLFSLCYTVIRDDTPKTFISFTNTVLVEVFGRSEEGESIIPTATQNGYVQFSEEEVSTDEMELCIGNASASINERVCVPVTAKNFRAIAGLELNIRWNAADLNFQELALGDDPLNYTNHPNAYVTNDSTFRTAWLPSTIEAADFGDSTVLFHLCFEVVEGENNMGKTFIEFFDLEIIEEVDGIAVLQDIETQNGFIDISGESQGPPATLSISNEVGNIGEKICLDVSLTTSEASGVQFALEWDTEKLVYEGYNLLEDGLLLSENDINFDGEQLRVLFYAPSVDNTDVPSYEIGLFDVCFTPLVRDTSYVQFSEDFPAEVVLSRGSALIPTDLELQNGYIYTDDNVRPGDTDLDTEASHYDLLNIGIGFGSTGPTRPNASLDFELQSAPDWAVSTPMTDVNYKHLDTNGDGVIDDLDILAVDQNWSGTPTLNNNTDSGDGVPFFAKVDSVRLMETQQIPIVLGTEEQTAQQVYSVAFSVYFETEQALRNAPKISLANSWLGSEEELIKIERFFPESQRLDVAISRIDQIAKNGQGELLAMDIVMEDVILFQANTHTPIRIDHVRAIGETEQAVAVKITDTQKVISKTESTVNLSITLSPNPVTSHLFIDADLVDIQQITIIDAYGKIVAIHAATSVISMEHLSKGMYVIRIETTKGNMTQKITLQ
ncbi:MAG: cohesin domain-containing protein [Bacteroidota bacterium]